MTFLMLESGAVTLAVLIAVEMWNQRRSWAFIVGGSLAVLGILTLMIGMWRGQ